MGPPTPGHSSNGRWKMKKTNQFNNIMNGILQPVNVASRSTVMVLTNLGGKSGGEKWWAGESRSDLLFWAIIRVGRGESSGAQAGGRKSF
jgi:hypothetical protein